MDKLELDKFDKDTWGPGGVSLHTTPPAPLETIGRIDVLMPCSSCSTGLHVVLVALVVVFTFKNSSSTF